MARKWFKYNKKILNDNSKYTMVISQVLLNIINLWPEKYSVVTKISFVVMFSTCATMEASLVIYLLTRIEDVASFTKVISSASVIMQVHIIKIFIPLILWQKSEESRV